MTRNQSVLVFIAIAIGSAATLWGLSQMSWPATYSLAWSPMHRLVFTFVVVAVIIEASARLFKVGRLTTGAIIACLIVIFAGAIWPLLVSIWFAFASYALGLAILAVLKIDKDRLSALTTFLSGAGAYGTAVGLLAHFPVDYPGLYGVALAIPVYRSINGPLYL